MELLFIVLWGIDTDHEAQTRGATTRRNTRGNNVVAMPPVAMMMMGMERMEWILSSLEDQSPFKATGHTQLSPVWRTCNTRKYCTGKLVHDPGLGVHTEQVR